MSSAILKTDSFTTFYFNSYQSWTYCNNCFTLLEDPIKFEDEVVIKKSQFVEHFLQLKKPEAFVKCQICYRKFHEVCVLHIVLSGEIFYCQDCRTSHGIKKLPIRASKLPKTDCDQFISRFLRTHLINEKETLTIRLLGDIEVSLKVKQMLQEFRNGADEFIYRDCTLFTFFDTGQDTDICFFAIYFQLYGSECSEPNRNTAYISYIDSTNLFPSRNRTIVYRLILIGLFDYLKTIGYETIYLWSCPSNQNQDYIFYMKPPHMKMPTRERLTAWYRELLVLGEKLKVIHSYSGIGDFALSNHWKSIDDVPYMEGDLWVTRMTEAVTSVKRESEKLKDEILKMKERKETYGSVNKLRDLDQRLAIKLKQITEYNKKAEFWRLMTFQINAFNNEYFAINLTDKTGSQKNIEMPTMNKWNWISNRHLFVDFFWGNMLEFSSERRAQYSTYVMLHRLFAESKICVQCGIAADSVSVS